MLPAGRLSAPGRGQHCVGCFACTCRQMHDRNAALQPTMHNKGIDFDRQYATAEALLLPRRCSCRVSSQHFPTSQFTRTGQYSASRACWLPMSIFSVCFQSAYTIVLIPGPRSIQVRRPLQLPICQIRHRKLCCWVKHHKFLLRVARMHRMTADETLMHLCATCCRARHCTTPRWRPPSCTARSTSCSS